MAVNDRTTAFQIPGLRVEGAFEGVQEQSQQEAKPYQIPPVFWMIFLLAVGYLGMRMVLED